MSAIIIRNDRVKAVKRKHPWIFSKAIKSVVGKPELGETIDVLDENNNWLATAAYSPHSQIRARIWSFDQSEQINFEFFKRKIQRAQLIRQPMIDHAQTTGYRLLCAESDGIPGLTIDVYNQVLVCQILSAGVEANKDVIFDALKSVFPEYVIYERSDVNVRQKEGLKNRRGNVFGDLPETVVINENGLKAYVDIENGHKTGFYLDQRDNRKTLEKYVADKTVLNCFSYTGTFGLTALKGGAQHVTQVDMSQSALDIASRNIDLNDFDQNKVTLIKHDVFKLLRQYREEGKKFDVIVMDPPKFAESKAQMRGACRGYKDINMLAIQLLNPGGILLSFSCSGLMDTSLFQKILADAALDAQRDMVFIEKLSQAQDHVISSVYPEGYYLKGFVAQVF